MLKKAQQLRQIDDPVLSKVFINRDLTPREREEEQALVSKLKQMRSQNKSMKYDVRNEVVELGDTLGDRAKESRDPK